MLKILFVNFALIISGSLLAQNIHPVAWHCTIKKISDGLFEIDLVAKIQQPWHIYAPDSPDDFSFPTTIKFNNNPTIHFDKQLKVVGKEQQKQEGKVSLKYYADEVEFVQTARLNNKVKTSVTGIVKFMACTDGQCLPPDKWQFTASMVD